MARPAPPAQHSGGRDGRVALLQRRHRALRCVAPQVDMFTHVHRNPRRFTWRASTYPLRRFKRTFPKVCEGLRPYLKAKLESSRSYFSFKHWNQRGYLVQPTPPYRGVAHAVLEDAAVAALDAVGLAVTLGVEVRAQRDGPVRVCLDNHQHLLALRVVPARGQGRDSQNLSRLNLSKACLRKVRRTTHIVSV
jgi:hypothetical protein